MAESAFLPGLIFVHHIDGESRRIQLCRRTETSYVYFGDLKDLQTAFDIPKVWGHFKAFGDRRTAILAQELKLPDINQDRYNVNGQLQKCVDKLTILISNTLKDAAPKQRQRPPPLFPRLPLPASLSTSSLSTQSTSKPITKPITNPPSPMSPPPDQDLDLESASDPESESESDPNSNATRKSKRLQSQSSRSRKRLKVAKKSVSAQDKQYVKEVQYMFVNLLVSNLKVFTKNLLSR